MTVSKLRKATGFSQYVTVQKFSQYTRTHHMCVSTVGMAMLGEQDSAGGTVDGKQQDEGTSVDPVTPTRRKNNNDEESSDRQQTSQVKAPASKHANKTGTTNQRTTAKSRK